ncbi:MAG TPA: rod shape-determining protein RodA [Candidatus Binataceae bacterium]|nr:rod shape-determining protein RodA [Candidatus Binataceae bacterium]
MPAIDRKMFGHFDWTLFLSVLALASIGMLSVTSASYAMYHHTFNALVTRQFLWVSIGAGIMVGALFFDYRAMMTYAYPIYLASLGLLIAVSVIGHSTGGSRRWINLGFFHLEPSELAKLAIVLVMVRYLREEPPRGGWQLRQMIIPGVMLGVPAVLVLKQPDLGTALVLVLISITLMFVSGLNWRTMAMLALAAMFAAPVSWHFLKPYQRQRLVSFIDPKADPLGSGYHIIQSEIAIGAGGPYGKGFMNGSQARLNFLPEETTDFIFAVFAEEFGMAGSLLLLALYASLIARGAWIARHARDRFGSLLALGVTGIVFWQVAINIAMTTGMLPVVGIPLPLVSYGGSSVLTMMTAMGLLISVNARRRTH